ncbi:MAG: hypothetical protein NG712_04070 [Omnitrophica bacterium]|nr:hypothetical protein [Candidatus Omnitrophota bacterium]
MKTGAILLIISSLLIVIFATQAEAKNSRVIRVSITIPAIVGVNVPAPTRTFADDKIVNPNIISQEEEIRTGKSKVVLRTILLK